MSAQREPGSGAQRVLRANGLLKAIGAALALAALAAGGPGVPDPSARLPSGDDAIEAWDLTLRLDSGHLIAARFGITNQGPGERNALVLGHIASPGKTEPLHFRNGRRPHRWSLSSGGRKMDVGTSHLDLSEPRWRLYITKKRVAMDLRIDVAALPPPARLPGGFAPEPMRLELLATAAPVSGKLYIRDEMTAPLEVTGRAAVLHSWTTRPEETSLLRRLEFFAQQDDGALYILELLDPQGGSRVWLEASRGGETLLATSELELGHESAPEGYEERGYSLPGQVRLTGDARGGITVEQPRIDVDPIDLIREPLRTLLRWSVDGRPRRVWADAEFEVTLRPVPGADPLRFQGPGLTAVAFHDPTPSERSR